jgi:translation initiation factor 2B subunit (eIF-2B alpha/beta/delta family)
VKDARATIRELASDRRSGAAEIAERAAEALCSVAPNELREALAALLDGHPSMAPLWRLASDVIGAPSVPAGASRFLEALGEDRRGPATLAPHLPERILTISWSSGVAETIRLRRPATVLCMLSVPGGEGARTARALQEVTDARIVDDDQAIRDLPAEAVVVGADAIAPDHIVNKVKTGVLCEAASSKGVPAYVVGGRTKLVDVALSVSSPFERVPLHLLTAVVVAGALLGPDEVRVAAQRSRLHPSLLPLLSGR